MRPTGSRLNPEIWRKRFWAKVDKTDTCWNWTGPLNALGYGRAHFQGHERKPHRLSYEMLVGPIPEGLELDHLCRNPSCVNPAHLEPVTHAENIRRGAPATKTHCKHGHEFTPENTYRTPSNGRRSCRTCNRITAALYYRTRRASSF